MGGQRSPNRGYEVDVLRCFDVPEHLLNLRVWIIFVNELDGWHNGPPFSSASGEVFTGGPTREARATRSLLKQGRPCFARRAPPGRRRGSAGELGKLGRRLVPFRQLNLNRRLFALHFFRAAR